MFGSLGPLELGIILLIAILIFGPKQLPKLGKSLGDTVREVRGIHKAVNGDDDDST